MRATTTRSPGGAARALTMALAAIGLTGLAGAARPFAAA
ncbi:MAG: hypothetical protein FD129_2256, partial [bacterium]